MMAVAATATVSTTAVRSSASTVPTTSMRCPVSAATMRSSATTMWTSAVYAIMDITAAEMLTPPRPANNPGVVMVAHNYAARSAAEMLICTAVVAKITIGTGPVNCHFVTGSDIVGCVARGQRRPEYPAGAV